MSARLLDTPPRVSQCEHRWTRPDPSTGWRACLLCGRTNRVEPEPVRDFTEPIHER